MKILRVESHLSGTDPIDEAIRRRGWQVAVAWTGELALSMLSVQRFDLVLTPLVPADIGALDLCRRARALPNGTPPILITIEPGISGRRVGSAGLPAAGEQEAFLDLASDLVKSVLEGDPLLLLAAGRVINLGSLQLGEGEGVVNLTPTERDLLKLLLSHPDKVVSRERILNRVWRITEDPHTNIIDVYIGRLRKKLGSLGSSLETVRGSGFRFMA
jgi:DNA-binding response OmpR family regulator